MKATKANCEELNLAINLRERPDLVSLGFDV
jgi:hypothetical protein